jgi:uncharacterized repeat protein (TIGR01451 family)
MRLNFLSVPYLRAKAHRLKAGGLNLVMENHGFVLHNLKRVLTHSRILYLMRNTTTTRWRSARHIATALATMAVLGSASQAMAQSVVKTGRDLTTQSTTDTQAGRTIRYAISLGLPTGQAAAAVDVIDAIPPGMEYVPGSLRLPANAVGGWSINNGVSYVGAEPSPASAVTHLRVTGYAYMAATSVMGTLPTPPLASASGGTGGDGYRALPYNGKVYSIYHHNGGDALYCGNQATGTACAGFPTSVPATAGSAFASVGGWGNWYETFNIVHEHLDRASGRLYFYARNVTTSKPVVVCADLNAQTSCGSYEFSNAADLSWAGMYSSGGSQGTRYYSSTNDGRMLCFDTATFAPCASTGADGTFPVTGTVSASATSFKVTQVGSRLYWPQQDLSVWPYPPGQLTCFDMATNGDCAGFTASPIGNNVGQAGVLPIANSAGVADGLCFEARPPQCFDLNGNDVTAAKAAFVTYMTPRQTAMQVYSYGLLLNGRTYWQGTQSVCWDWATNAACAGYDASTGFSNYWYESTYDPAYPSCVWALGDRGVLTATDAIDGGPCKVEVKTQIQAAPSANYCDGQAHPSTWARIALMGLQASDYASAKVTIRDATNAILPGWNATTTTFPVDLSAYPMSGNTASLSVEVELLGITNVAPFNVDPKPYVSVQWQGDPQQVCFDAKLACGGTLASPLSNTVTGNIGGTTVSGSHAFTNVAQACWVPPAAGTATPVPVLNKWGILVLLALMFGTFAWSRRREA